MSQIFNSLSLAKKILNVSNSLTIQCMQHSLYQTAFEFIKRSFKVDLAFFEVQYQELVQVKKWRGRILLSNIIAYFFYLNKDFGNALKYTFEAQSLSVDLNEGRNRDCDYIISVNFVTFLILWKIGKFEEGKKYVDLNKKLIESMIEDDIVNLPELLEG